MSHLSVAFPAEKPFLPQLLEYLLAGSAPVPLDLSQILVVVPTQNAGRRLRQRLAQMAATQNTGVLAPQIVTPDQLIAPPPGTASATPADVLAAWAALLQELELDEFRAVFPHDPAHRDVNWATGLAHQLSLLQRQLGEHGFDCSVVAARVEGTEFDSDRWAALAELERRWQRLLREKDLLGPNEAKRMAAAENEPPPNIARLVVAGVIDPLPLSIQVLERWSERLTVEIVSHGPAELFDRWGRVVADAVENRVLPLEDGATLRVVRDIKDAATLTASLAVEYKDNASSLAIGALDPACTQALELAFHRRALTAHELGGVSLGSSGLGLLAIQLLALVNEVRPDFMAQILRHPEFADFAVQSRGWAEHQADLLIAFDRTMNEHLPSELPALIAFARRDAKAKAAAEQNVRPQPDLAAALDWLAQLGDEFKRGRVSETLRSALSSLVGQREYELANEADATRGEELEALGDLLEDFAQVELRFPTLKTDVRAAVLKRTIQTARRFPKAPPEGWDLQGWLELVYEDAPHLVLVGMNEGSVPETIRGDIFLPNSLRQFLGLRSNHDRYQRDQVLLENHLCSRARAGRVDLIVPRMSDSGNPLQPSRLLFACSDAELVTRAKQLFAELPPPPPTPARRAAWQLEALPAEAPRSFSPSKLKAYLACPFRYYLHHVLKMEAVKVGQHELTASSFGDFCHAALEQLGKDPSMHDAKEAGEIANYLAGALNRIAGEKLGDVDSFALRVQLESARARLNAAAELEAQERAEGWRIERAEEPWTIQWDNLLIKGRIDRIDRNLHTGAYRLIDYKTNDRGKSPQEAHWIRHKPEDRHALPESIFGMDGRHWRWLDLQLPLYLLALRQAYGSDISAGYFVLPKTKEGTAIHLWTELTREHLSQVETCARAVARAVADGRFWPPAELRYEDDADYLFPDGILASVKAAGLERFSFKKPVLP